MTGKRILLIEDEYLVALELQRELEDAGFAEVVHAASEREALQRLDEGHWDAAIADANLNGRTSKAVGAALREQGIPFVVATGYGRESLPPELAEAPLLSKPIYGRRLVQEVTRLCNS